MRLFPLLFIIIPILEMWLLIEVGGEIGALNTVALVFLTAIIGFALLRHQGVSTLARAQQRMAEGQMPAKEMAEGICLAVGGALLLTPGFITDAFGFVCLLPGLRHILIGSVLSKMQLRAQAGHNYQGGFQGGFQTGQTFEHETHSSSESSRSKPEVIEGQFKRSDD